MLDKILNLPRSRGPVCPVKEFGVDTVSRPIFHGWLGALVAFVYIPVRLKQARKRKKSRRGNGGRRRVIKCQLGTPSAA